MIEVAAPSAAPPLLSVEGLSIAYGARRSRKVVLADVSLGVDRGEAIGIVGESGSGKTTLAKAIMGIVEPLAGAIRFEGHDLARQTQAERRRFRRSGAVRYVFQDPLGSLDPQWTVFQSIEEALILKGEPSKAVREQTVLAAADDVRLDRDLLDKRPAQLSGGQRQRAAIARTLAGTPKMLIADEPVSALDSTTRVQILELFAQLRRKTGIAQIFISHDLGSVAFLVDRVVVLNAGRIVESGPPASVIGDPQHEYTKQLVAAVPRLRL
jgi:ABC-type glutathione transport system ATPase component